MICRRMLREFTYLSYISLPGLVFLFSFTYLLSSSYLSFRIIRGHSDSLCSVNLFSYVHIYLQERVRNRDAELISFTFYLNWFRTASE